MKRSTYIALGAVGFLAVAALWPRDVTEDFASDPAVDAGRNDGFQTLAFASVEECKESQVVTQATCDSEFARAAQQSVQDAPKFESIMDCAAEYGTGQCRPATWNGASVFIPALTGMLIARSLTGAGAVASQPLYPPRTGPAICPSGVDVTARPECAARGTGSAGGGRFYYSTGAGRVISRPATLSTTDTVLPPRAPVSRNTVARAGSSARIPTVPSTGNRPWSQPSPGPSRSAPTVSRGGFGSTGRSFSVGG